jgi:hypothetical protein
MCKILSPNIPTNVLFLASTSSSLTLVTISLPLYLHISIKKFPYFSLHLGGFLGVKHEPQIKELENCVDAKGSCCSGKRRWQVYNNVKCQSSLLSMKMMGRFYFQVHL